MSRFSEGKVIIQVVFTPYLVQKVNELAEQYNISRSTLIRDAVIDKYFKEDESAKYYSDKRYRNDGS